MYSASVIRKFKVCLNNAARLFFGYDRFCSASAMHVCEGIDNFDTMYRKAAWGFNQRLCSSKNSIINSLFDSDVGRRSPFRASWNDAYLAH